MFVPLKIRVSLAALYKRGKLKEKFLKAELFEPEVRNANGLRSVCEQEWQGLVKTGKRVDRFDLSGYKSGDVAKYIREYELAENFELNIGFKALSLESKVTAKFSSKQKVSMTFELPAGRVYALRRPPLIAGFYFGS